MPVKNKNLEKLEKISGKKKKRPQKKTKWQLNLEKRKEYLKEWIEIANDVLKENLKEKEIHYKPISTKKISFNDDPEVVLFFSRQRVTELNYEKSLNLELPIIEKPVKTILKPSSNSFNQNQ